MNCPTCGKPMGKAGYGLSGAKKIQLWRCSHEDCSDRYKRKMLPKSDNMESDK